MEVTPQLLNEQEFREARRGYDMRDVDEFLERVAVGVARLQERLQDAMSENEQQRSRAGRLEAEVTELKERGSVDSETDETLRRTLVLAQRTADAAVAEAEETAARTVERAEEQAEALLEDAKESAERIRAESESQAQQAGEDARRRMREELASLESTRDALDGDVRTLRRYLDEARARLRASASELQRLVDDPAALGELAEPDLSAAEAAVIDDSRPDDSRAGGDGPRDAPEVPAGPGGPELLTEEVDLDLEADDADTSSEDRDYFEELRRVMHDSDGRADLGHDDGR